MFAVLMTFLYGAFQWIMRTVVLKAIVYGIMFFVLSDLCSYLADKLPTGDGGLSSTMAGWSSSEWFFFDFFQLQVGLPAILAAFGLKFAIRRLPIIG